MMTPLQQELFELISTLAGPSKTILAPSQMREQAFVKAELKGFMAATESSEFKPIHDALLRLNVTYKAIQTERQGELENTVYLRYHPSTEQLRRTWYALLAFFSIALIAAGIYGIVDIAESMEPSLKDHPGWKACLRTCFNTYNECASACSLSLFNNSNTYKDISDKHSAQALEIALISMGIICAIILLMSFMLIAGRIWNVNPFQACLQNREAEALLAMAPASRTVAQLLELKGEDYLNIISHQFKTLFGKDIVMPVSQAISALECIHIYRQIIMLSLGRIDMLEDGNANTLPPQEMINILFNNLLAIRTAKRFELPAEAASASHVSINASEDMPLLPMGERVTQAASSSDTTVYRISANHYQCFNEIFRPKSASKQSIHITIDSSSDEDRLIL